MKKYIQITVVLGLFFLLVLFRQLHGNDTTTPIVVPSPSNSQSNSSSTSTTYKDGTYTGNVTDAFYGNMQVKIVISGGKISDIQFLQYPNDNGTTQQINSQALPILKQEALTAQSAQVDIVSGASDSSQAFQQSLASALQQAQ